MIVALALLSVAMIAGGLYGVLQGWEIVVLERGWALVIASSIAAASGVLLLGLTAAVARLGGIRKDLARLAERLARADMPAPPAFDPTVALPASLLPEDQAAAPAEAPPAQREDEPMLPLF